MEKMKRLTALMIALMIAALLCACGAGQSEDSADAEDEAYEYETGAVTEMPEFKSIDLEGNEVDNSIFSEADINVVNFWGTFCGPCIGEMPELAAWDSELPDNVRIIGVVTDVESESAEEFETAKQLVAENGIEYTNIIIGDQFGEVLENLVGVPTTFFVDSGGRCLSAEVIGADVEKYKETAESLQ